MVKVAECHCKASWALLHCGMGAMCHLYYYNFTDVSPDVEVYN